MPELGDEERVRTQQFLDALENYDDRDQQGGDEPSRKRDRARVIAAFAAVRAEGVREGLKQGAAELRRLGHLAFSEWCHTDTARLAGDFAAALERLAQENR